MKIKRAHRFPALAAMCMVMSCPAYADTLYWDGNVSTANDISENSSTSPMNWLSGGNWDNGTTSTSLGSWTGGDTAIFGGTFSGTQTVTLGSGISLGDGTTIGGTGSSYNISITGTGYNQLSNPSGTITIQAGSTLSADAPSDNAHNLGPITLNGGTLTSINGPAGPANDGGYGNWVLRGVTTGGASLSTISSTTFSIISGSFNVADAVAGSGTDLLVSSNISAFSPVALIKNGAGTMELTGANSYTTATSVNQGKLVINGNISTSSLTTVAAAAALGGNGTVGALTISGDLAPGGAGVDIKTLSAGTTTWNGGSNLWNFDLSADAGSSDKLAISGDFTKGADTVFKFDFMGSAPNAWGNAYTLVTWTGTSNFLATDFSFQNLGGSFNGPGSGFTISGKSLVFTAVPEPTSAALVGLLITAGFLRRRR